MMNKFGAFAFLLTASSLTYLSLILIGILPSESVPVLLGIVSRESIVLMDMTNLNEILKHSFISGILPFSSFVGLAALFVSGCLLSKGIEKKGDSKLGFLSILFYAIGSFFVSLGISNNMIPPELFGVMTQGYDLDHLSRFISISVISVFSGFSLMYGLRLAKQKSQQ